MKFQHRFLVLAALMLASATWVFAQQPDISFMRTYDQNGTGIFEAPKSEDFNFDFDLIVPLYPLLTFTFKVATDISRKYGDVCAEICIFH